MILGIESSFNDTGVAIVRADGKVLANVTKTFEDRYQGESAPLRAADHHVEQLPIAYKTALDLAGVSMTDISAVAVTLGPGQMPALQAGLSYALGLGKEFDLPVIPVNHLEAHVMTGRMVDSENTDFPYLSVLATGGHTELVMTRGVGLHTIMGITVDLAVGVFIDSAVEMALARKDILGDEKQIRTFVYKYN